MKEYQVKWTVNTLLGTHESSTMFPTHEEAEMYAAQRAAGAWVQDVKVEVREVSEWEEV